MDNVIIVHTSWYYLAYVVCIYRNITDCTSDFWTLTFAYYRHLFKKNYFEIKIFSSSQILRNALGSLKTCTLKSCTLLHTACTETVPLSNFVFRQNYKPRNQIRTYCILGTYFPRIFEQFTCTRSYCKLHRYKKDFFISCLNLATAFSLEYFFLLDFRYTMFLCLILFFSNSDKLRCRFR